MSLVEPEHCTQLLRVKAKFRGWIAARDFTHGYMVQAVRNLILLQWQIIVLATPLSTTSTTSDRCEKQKVKKKRPKTTLNLKQLMKP